MHSNNSDDLLRKSNYVYNHSCDPDEASALVAYSKMKEHPKSMPSEFPGQIMGNLWMDLHDEM